MESSTKYFNEKMSNLMKQLLDEEKRMFNHLLSFEKNKAKKIMVSKTGSEDLTLRENWEILTKLGITIKQTFIFDNSVNYYFKENSDYFVRFRKEKFSESVKDAIISSNFDSCYEDIFTFYNLKN